MTHQDERRLMRLLHGELGADERRALEARLERDEDLRRCFAALRSGWDSLAEPPFGEVPAEFRAGVLGAARRLRGDELSWSTAPAWVRLGAAAALVVGIGLGVGVGRTPEPRTDQPQTAAAEPELTASSEIAEPLSLAETFWMGFEDDTTTGEETP